MSWMQSHKRREPCGNCPFLKSAPLAHWHPTMYQLLASIEQGEGEVGSNRVFGCHKDVQCDPDEREYCVGWLLNQRAQGVPNIALRIALMVGDHSEAAVLQFNECTSGDVYKTVAELVAANLAHDKVLNPERYESR